MKLITAHRVLLGPAEHALHDGAVLLDGTRIHAVGPRQELAHHLPADTPREHHPHATLLPGLINMHVHLSFDSGPDPVATLRDQDEDSLLSAMLERAQQALRAGVTTVRDLGDRDGAALRLRTRIAHEELAAPRILAAAAPLTVPHGHCWFLGGVVEHEHDIRERVHRTAAQGADLVKVMASGGQLTPGSPPMWQSQFTPHELSLIVDEATRLGLPVAAHAHGSDAIEAAVRAGVSTVEHCTWMGPHGQDRRRHVAERMAEHGIYACAASSRNWRALVDRAGPERARQIHGRLSWMADLGVPLVTGTDAGLPGSVFDDFVGALELYEYLGFTPATILDMATVTSAAALGLGDRLGRIAAGYEADLLVVDGDPRTDGLAVLRHPRRVLTRGHTAVATDGQDG
ncbi:amidohydrolase family protein [Actinopolyspora mortivallis]|uniref:amidohydrolase family protein n=1 Tax=Actinopolyspora mortivallis TaxID=33906 RepID=UPI00036DA710|nr:amidohydrolase family protein [Actinopolyspora mortivallis]